MGVPAAAGILAGLLVPGLGGRIAMRIAGAMSDPSLVGAARTENGNIVGDITAGGTTFLLVSGAFEGLAAGLLYAAVRPWLLPFGRWAGPAYGMAILAAAGAVVLDPGNVDFRKFGSAPVNLLTFALLFPLYGLALDRAVVVLEERIRGRSLRSPWGALVAIGLLAVAALVFFVGVALVGLIVRVASGTAGLSFSGDGRGAILPLFLLVVMAARAVLARRGDDARRLTAPERAVTYGALATPAVAGLPTVVEAIRLLAR
jgi:hypothetical protein